MRIVTANRIAELANENKVKNLDPILIFAGNCYEAGMIEILREIAEKELERFPSFKMSPYTNKVTKQVEEKYQLLKNSLNQPQIEVLEDYDDDFHSLIAAESGDYFVEGFVHGYKYLKTEIVHKN